MSQALRVLVAGIGGASLGTELLKALAAAGCYETFGCDISRHAYGHYQSGSERTFVVDREGYAESVLGLCRRYGIRAVIPGGEQPLALLTEAAEAFRDASIHIAANAPGVIRTCSDKARCFERLTALSVPVPRTAVVADARALPDVGYPCVVKPATGTGGSSFVFLAADRTEAALYANYVLANRQKVLMQEYVPADYGEFTIGVLSLSDGRVAGSMAMRRIFHTKLSLLAKTASGLISSGYSQGLVDEFPDVRRQAEGIARSLGSTGPLNVQGRLRGGVLVPFEINPRFSATTFLRAMAGFNEVDVYLRHVLRGEEPSPPMVRPGYYLRSLAEVYVPESELRGGGDA